jgi:hypothetical protein
MNYSLICCICHKDIEPDRDVNGDIYYHGGNNPSPISDEGWCCNSCNQTIVTPARMAEIQLSMAMKKGGQS